MIVNRCEENIAEVARMATSRPTWQPWRLVVCRVLSRRPISLVNHGRLDGKGTVCDGKKEEGLATDGAAVAEGVVLLSFCGGHEAR